MNVISAGSVTAETDPAHKIFAPEHLLQVLDMLTDQSQFCIAYSGGLDSHVLLHAMSELAKQQGINVRAVHINHGLNPDANQWEQHCREVCHHLGVEFISESVQLNIESGDSVEARARDVRYGCFEKLLHPHENLITAHTKNDQAETLLLQLMRGSGVKGLAAMPAKKYFSRGYLLRPLLTFTREQLQTYANQHALKWVEDDSNFAMRFDRNYIRHQIIPKLQERWPEMLTTFTRSAKHCASSAELLDELADIDLKWVSDETNQSLLINALLQLSKQRQRNVLRRWIILCGHRMPHTKHLDQIDESVLQASEDAQPKVSWGNVEIRRYQNRLYLMNALVPHDASRVIPWDLKKSMSLPGDLGTLAMERVKGFGISKNCDVSNITIRFRQGGESCRPKDRNETHSLKKLWQAWEVPPWQRDRIPLIYDGDTLIAVVGYCICEGYAAKGDEEGIDITLVSSSHYSCK